MIFLEPTNMFFNTRFKIFHFLISFRIMNVHEKSFFVGSLGQMELQGPLVLNITFPTTGSSWVDETPILLYWNCGEYL